MMGVGAKRALGLYRSCAPRQCGGGKEATREVCLLFIHPSAHGSEVSPAARNTLDSARIPRASKLLICGLFQKGRVLAQDGGTVWRSGLLLRLHRRPVPKLSPFCVISENANGAESPNLGGVVEIRGDPPTRG